MTEKERTAVLRHLVEVAEAHADGRVSNAQAHHDLQHLIAPRKRRVNRLERRR